MLSSHLRLCLPSGLLLSGLPTKMYAPLTSPMRATCPAHIILLALITLIILGEKDKPLQRPWSIEYPDIRSSKSHVHFPCLRSFQSIGPSPRPFVTFRNVLFFYGGELLAPGPTPKLEGLSAVSDRLFNIFADTLHIWRPSPPSVTWGRAIPWWQGTHLTWHFYFTDPILTYSEGPLFTNQTTSEHSSVCPLESPW
jgi:hypothetical protein